MSNYKYLTQRLLEISIELDDPTLSRDERNTLEREALILEETLHASEEHIESMRYST